MPQSHRWHAEVDYERRGLSITAFFPFRLFGVLFRLLRLQVSNHIGSAQLTEDSLWVFVRIALTYLSVNVPAGTDCRLEDLKTVSPYTLTGALAS